MLYRRRFLTYPVSVMTRLMSVLLLIAIHQSGAIAAVPAPSTLIKTASGTPFVLYDATAGYFAKPYRGGLLDRGFNRIVGWSGYNLAGVQNPPAWWASAGGTAPTYTLADGSSDQQYVTQNMSALCAAMIPGYTTLVYADLEWLFIDGTGNGPFTMDPMNTANLGTVLRWMRTALQSGPCNGRIRITAYGIPQSGAAAFNIFYAGNPNQAAAASWRSAVQSIITQLAPVIDVLTPSLYAVYSATEENTGTNPCGSGFGVNHVTAWTNVANEFLNEARTGAASYSLGVAPFLGLRYYTFDGGTCSADPNANKFIESSFFQNMLSVVTSSSFALEGAVYWDYAAGATDGTEYWSNDYPWVTSTFSFFVAPQNTFSKSFTPIVNGVVNGW